MREHLKILGILNIVMGAFTALGGLAALVVMGGMAGVITASSTDHDTAVAAPIIAGIGVAVGIFLLLLSLPSVIGGWGLMKYRPWSRVLMIVISVLHLLNVPFGTALGVYGLWVLFSEDGRRILESGGQTYVTPAYPAAAPAQQPMYPPPGV